MGSKAVAFDLRPEVRECEGGEDLWRKCAPRGGTGGAKALGQDCVCCRNR